MEPYELEKHLNLGQPNDYGVSNLNSISEQTKFIPATFQRSMEPVLPRSMEPVLPRFKSFYELCNEAATSKTYLQTVEPTCPQMETTSIESENTVASDSEFSMREVDTILNNTQIGSTLQNLKETPETVLPRIKMVFSEYTEGCEENFEELDAISNIDAYELGSEIRESGLLKNITDLGANSSNCIFIDTNNHESTKTKQIETEIVYRGQSVVKITECCRLERGLSSNSEETVMGSLKGSEFSVEYNCEKNNSLSTQAVNKELPQTVEVFSEKNEKLQVIPAPLRQQTEEVEVAKLELSNGICDKSVAKIEEKEKTALSVKRNISNSEQWKEIAIKQEILDEDDIVIDHNSLNLESCVDLDLKSELHIKTEDLERLSKRIFMCKQCSKEFYLECTYLLHVMAHKRTTVCCRCPYKISKRKKMLNHLRSHTGEKKVRCKICKEFYYPHNEFQHFQTCPKPKRYQCEECEYSTDTKFYYLRHQQYHFGAQEKCPRCDLHFFDKPALKKHYKCHTKDKPFQCHICYRRFKARLSRDNHILASCDRKCSKCDHVSINCVDIYEHVKAAHYFSKLRLHLQKVYRQYDKILSKNANLVNVVHQIDPEVVNYDTTIIEGKVEFTEYEISQNIEQNCTYEVAKADTDYELVESDTIKCEPTTFGADYDYWMQNDRLHPVENAGFLEHCLKGEGEENAMYELMQNVDCELTEENEDYTLLCL